MRTNKNLLPKQFAKTFVSITIAPPLQQWLYPSSPKQKNKSIIALFISLSFFLFFLFFSFLMYQDALDE